MILNARVRRKGAIHTVELLLLLPIFLLLGAGMIQFSLTLSAKAKLSAASKGGARVAALGGNLDAVVARIKKSLGEKVVRHANIRVCYTHESDRPPTTGELVQVCIKVKTNVIVPDLLRFTGIQLGERELVACTVMRIE